MAADGHTPVQLVSAILNVIQQSIIPLTREGVESGSKLFGAAILSHVDLLHPLTVAANNERLSPLLHGEVQTIQQFFSVDFPDPASRPNPRDCLFVTSHEPCSLCLSALAWSGFKTFVYLFSHEETRSRFSIPFDIDILQELFSVRGDAVEPGPLYNRSNRYFTGRSLADVVATVDEPERKKWLEEIDRVKGMYDSLNRSYQEAKTAEIESSSTWR